MKYLITAVISLISSHVALANCGFPMDFTFSQSTCNPRSITFTNNTTNIISTTWEFGDGFTSSGNPVTHIYLSLNVYQVKLIVQFTNGCIDTLIKLVPVVSTADPGLITNNDTTICQGTNVALSSIPGLSLCWQPITGMSNPNINNPIVTPLTSTTYFYTTLVQGSNLVTNGNFTLGNTGFISDYTSAFPNTLEAQYWIGNNPNSWNSNFNSCVEHTTGTGNMMMVNGSSIAGAKVWSQTISVLPNTNYSFSLWIQSLAALNPARLRFSINNVILGDNINAGNTACQWNQFYTVWNSGNNASAIITIVNNNTIASGNDFAIDDIFFSKLDLKYDSVKINVISKPNVLVGNDTTICSGTTAQLLATGANNYIWSPSTGLSNPNIANPIATPSASTQYIVTGYNIPGCTDSDTINITVNPDATAEFTFSQDACNPMRISFINNTQNPLIGQWYFGDGNTSSALNPVHTYAAPGTYNVKLVVTNTSGCTDSIVKPVSVNIANENVILTSDTTICLGQSIQLNTIANSDFCWQNGQYLNNANISNPIATPTQTITYYFNTKTLGNNLVNNGSFTGGNSGFSSQYIYTTSNNTEGQYFVGSNPPAWNSLFSNCTDHTTGTGNMLLVNGSPQPDVKVWCQSLAVLPNTNYEFSAWVQSVFPDNPAKLQFSINGIQVGNIFTAGSVCSWQRYGASWSSGNSTTANICIENKNTVIWGNDFALDDISLAPVTMRRDSITITVVPAPVILASNDTTICAGSSVQLNATGATIYSWTPSGGLSDPNIADPLATPSATTQYIVSGYDIPGCVVKDTVNISVDPQPVFSINPVQTNICEGDVLTITASGADNYQWFSGSQGNLSTNSQLQVTISTPEIYYVAMTDLSCNITDTLSSTITLSPKPQVTITKSNDIDCSLTQAQLIATGGATYSWTPVQNINNPGISYPMVYPDKDTWYKVIVTDGQGCSTVDSILVKSDLSKGQGNFLVSNGFTPNNDGKNDCFGVRYWGISSDFEFSIYNRWGELIFQTRDSQKCWDGTYKGMKQPPGVYVYQVKTKSPCSPVPVYRKGTVALIR